MLITFNKFKKRLVLRSFSEAGGLTLIEVLVGTALLLIVTLAVYQSYVGLSKQIGNSRWKILAADLANEQFEIIRNLPYSDVGIQGSIPSGKLQHIQTVSRDKTNFTVTITVRNNDDPFDGTIGGTPNDLSPADYKVVEVEIGCALCPNFQPVKFSGRVAPKNLETASTNGALFIQVFDANGNPIQGANINIQNSSTSPAITIDDVTNNAGILQIVDAIPSQNSYRITVSKSGYSTDRTYTPGGFGNPVPTKPHATVVLQQVTQISFSIDRTSTLNFSSLNQLCAPTGNFLFNMRGAKLIGTGVYKYNQQNTTNASGLLTLSNLEWDTYGFTSSSSLEILGTNPVSPIQILPNSTNNLTFILGPKNPNTLLVSVIDSATGLPLSGATVTVQGAGGGSATSIGSQTQTDWSGGGGQATSTDLTKFFSMSNLDTSSPTGELKLASTTVYAASGVLESSAFILESTSTLREINWNPNSEPPQTGSDSVKFQVASSIDGSAWNFIGPDGTSGSYYTLSNRDLSTRHQNVKYAKYRVFLSTADTNYTPNVSDVSFTYSGNCEPAGQTVFTGLTSGVKNISVSKSGYSTYNDTVNIVPTWQALTVPLVIQ